jgi:hypothetical protein
MTRCSSPRSTRQDRDRGLLSEGDAQFGGQATREILDVLAHDAPAPSERDTGDRSLSDPGADTRVRIVGCPARDEADALALEMVRHLLDPARYRNRPAGPGTDPGPVGRFDFIKMVEAVGIEPTSGNPQPQASTSIAGFLLLSPPDAPTGWISGRPAPLGLTPHPGAGFGASHRNMTPEPGPR